MWGEPGQETRDRRQARHLAARLGLHRAIAAGHLARLQAWAADHAPDGALTGCSPRTIARAAGWRGDPITLLEALAQARCLERRPGGPRLREWPAVWDLYSGRPGGRQPDGQQPGGLQRAVALSGPRLHVHGLWQAALRELAGMVNRANFEAFLGDTVGLYQSGAWVTVGAPSAYISETLAQRFRTAMDRALFEVSGLPLRTRIVCLPPAAPDPA